jgi:3-polyprenyl-4-hydroxybenzoate decarboxylase
MSKRLVVGLSGASGAPLCIALLEGMRLFPEWEVHLVIIMPPVLTYYNQPRGMEDMAGHLVGKVMPEFGLEPKGFRRWQGSKDLD